MATTRTGAAIAAPQIFTSDPIEQIYAKGTLDPVMGGIAYGYLNAAQGDRAAGQAEYMKALHESNLMAQQLGQHEADQQTLQTLLKEVAPMTTAGVDPATIPLMQKIYGNVNDPNVTMPVTLRRQLLAAEAAAKNSEVAKNAQAGLPKVQIDTDYTTTGPSGSTVRITGTNSDAVQREVQRQAENRQKAYGYPTGPAGPGSMPTIAGSASAADAAIRDKQARDARDARNARLQGGGQ